MNKNILFLQPKHNYCLGGGGQFLHIYCLGPPNRILEGNLQILADYFVKFDGMNVCAKFWENLL